MYPKFTDKPEKDIEYLYEIAMPVFDMYGRQQGHNHIVTGSMSLNGGQAIVGLDRNCAFSSKNSYAVSATPTKNSYVLKVSKLSGKNFMVVSSTTGDNGTFDYVAIGG